MRLLAVLFVALIYGGTGPQEPEGFAGLAGSADSDSGVDFLQPGPGDRLVFPGDFGPHPQHRIEWWYLTANLQTQSGEPLGLQWTQFRQALTPRARETTPPAAARWPLEAAWMAHAAVSYNGQHRFAERLARGDVGNAGAAAQPFSVWLDHWQLQPAKDTPGWRLKVAADTWSYDLALQPQREPVAHGDQGFSAKSASGEGSMYFSLVDLRIEGTVTLDGKTLSVTGTGWFDREWSSQFLKAGQQGWDWFALHLDSGDKLMAFRLREDEGGFRSGTWIPAQGEPVALKPGELAIDATGNPQGYPRRWQITVPRFGVALEVAAPEGDYLNAGFYPYWESPVSVGGSHTGVGYMELTGYPSE
ncbi:lipocalin-like domain-containing protein [Marinobacter sp. VGCF2001]|uniref:lipocalin-like domain-containing protein n=1 Tax=Marinobacter sp. VGCF2001 TaxID=3417189 RepID=UPI003CEDF9C0